MRIKLNHDGLAEWAEIIGKHLVIAIPINRIYLLKPGESVSITRSRFIEIIKACLGCCDGKPFNETSGGDDA